MTKNAISVLLLIGLLAIPIGCVLAICPAVDHDCCPKSASVVSACPYDILSSARTAAVSPAVTLSAAVLPLPAPRIVDCRAIVPYVSLLPDSSELHLLNRILLI